MKKRSRRTKRRRKSRKSKTRRRRAGQRFFTWRKKPQPNSYELEDKIARAQELQNDPNFFSTMNKMSRARKMGSLKSMKRIFDENYSDTPYTYKDFANLGLNINELNNRSKKIRDNNRLKEEDDLQSVREVYLGGKKKKRKRKRKKRRTKKR